MNTQIDKSKSSGVYIPPPLLYAFTFKNRGTNEKT